MTCCQPLPVDPQALRTGVAIAILIAARSLPFLAYLMALVGSFMTISVSVTFPALCHLVGATRGARAGALRHVDLDLGPVA